MKKAKVLKGAAILSAAVCLLCCTACSKDDKLNKDVTDYNSIVDSINIDNTVCKVSLYGSDMNDIPLSDPETIETANDFLLNVISNEQTEPYDHKSDDFPVGAPFVKAKIIDSNKKAYTVYFTFFNDEEVGKVDVTTDNGTFTYSVDNQDIAKFYYYISDLAQEAAKDKPAAQNTEQ